MMQQTEVTPLRNATIASPITPKRVIKGGAHSTALALGHHSFELQTAKGRQAVNDTTPDFNRPRNRQLDLTHR